MGNFIEHIEIENFKSIRHQVIDGCKRINVFIGYPNVGKSNILEAIGLFSVLNKLRREDFNFDDICRVRHFSELYFNQDYRKITQVKVINKDNDGLQCTIANPSNSSTLQLIIWALFKEKERLVTKSEFHFNIEYKGYTIYPNSNSNVFSYDNFISVIKKYNYLNNSPVHLINEKNLSVPYGYNLLDVLQQEQELRRDLSEILKPYNLRLLLDTGSESIMLIKELEDGSVLRIPYHQIADTLKRLVFYKAAIASNQDSILLFEEPEAHMFPPYISKFTADIIYNKDNGNQYFLNTHSPFVLNDFLEDARDELSVFVVGYKDGETVIKRLTDEQLHEIYQYGVDLFLNIEDYLN